MKKSIVVVSAIILAMSPAVAKAEPVSSIAIIDQRFDTSTLDTNILEVCVVACNDKSVPNPKVDGKQAVSDYNHGTQMAEIIRKNNPTAKLILIRAGATNSRPVTSQGLREALAWIIANYKTNNIKVVSASINAGNPNSCSPVGGVSQSEITSKIDALNSAGVSIIASAGNSMFSKTLNYPACISNVIAVTSPNRQGIGNNNLDYLVRTDKLNFTTSYGPISFLTTSATTALVAANWEKLSNNQANTGLQIRLNVLQ